MPICARCSGGELTIESATWTKSSRPGATGAVTAARAQPVARSSKGRAKRALGLAPFIGSLFTSFSPDGNGPSHPTVWRSRDGWTARVHPPQHIERNAGPIGRRARELREIAVGRGRSGLDHGVSIPSVIRHHAQHVGAAG